MKILKYICAVVVGFATFVCARYYLPIDVQSHDFYGVTSCYWLAAVMGIGFLCVSSKK